MEKKFCAVALTCLEGGGFDRLNRQHSGEFDQNVSRKVKCPGVCARGGWAVLELTGT